MSQFKAKPVGLELDMAGEHIEKRQIASHRIASARSWKAAQRMFPSRIRASAAAVVSGTTTGNSARAIVETRSTPAIQASKMFQKIGRSTVGDFSANGRFVIVATSVSDIAMDRHL